MSRKILIVGGVAGGANVAARLRRLDEDAEIIVFEKGTDVSYANCGLPYYIGGLISDREDLLLRTPEDFRDRFNVEVRILNEVQEILPESREIKVHDLNSGEIYRESYDYLVLSMGAKPMVPAIKGIEAANVFTLRDIADSDGIKAFVDRRKPAKALIIGGGFIGLEMAENLKRRGVRVTIAEAADQVMASLDQEMAALLHGYLRENGIEVRLNSKIIALLGQEKAEKAVFENGEEIDADMIVVCVGVSPENSLAKKAGLSIAASGGIVVDRQMRTTGDCIYAIGDAVCVEHFATGQSVLVPLAVPAAKQARVAANHICGRESEYRGTQATAIAKIFNLVAASTGANEKTLKLQGTAYEKCYLHPASHATYYPGAEEMAIKLIFTPETGTILGAQIIGEKGVDKRIDVIAAMMRGGLSVFELAEVELAYAPPFSAPKDPVNMAAYAAVNLLNGDNTAFYWDDVGKIDPDKSLLLDVRSEEEAARGMLPQAVNIPLEQLRGRLAELPANKDIYVYCRVGIKAYNALRLLRQRGFSRVWNLSGGYLTYAPTQQKF